MMSCPKCHGPMQTYNRQGVQLEQCTSCRGIFLDYGELEALSQLGTQWAHNAPPPPPPPHGGHASQPHWGTHYGHQPTFGKMLFSS